MLRALQEILALGPFRIPRPLLLVKNVYKSKNTILRGNGFMYVKLEVLWLLSMVSPTYSYNVTRGSKRIALRRRQGLIKNLSLFTGVFQCQYSAFWKVPTLLEIKVFPGFSPTRI
jgi:hypothetical protein